MKTVLLFFLLLSNIYSQWSQIKCETIPKTWGICNFLDVLDSTDVYFTVNTYPKPFYFSNNGGATWNEIIIPDQWPLIVTGQENFLWCCTDTKVYYSNNSGVGWVVQKDLASQTGFIDYIKMFDLNNGIIIGDAPSSSKPLLVQITSDGGNTWNTLNNTMLGASSRDQFFPIDFVDSKNGYFSDSKSNKLYSTEDGGVTWTELSYPAQRIFMLRFYNKNLGIFVADNFTLSTSNKLFRTTDGGKSWKELSLETKSSGSHHDIEFLPGDPSKVWFTDYDKLYFSSDTGNTWKECKISDGILKGRNIKFTDQNHGWLLCDDGKLFHTTNNGAVATEVKKDDSYLVASLKTYPNPFNPNTTVEYTVAKEGFVQLKIFDIVGAEISTLVNSEVPAGKHKITFDASNLGAGIYLCQFKSGEFIKCIKLVYMK